jgi:hypothetical protein
MRRGVGVGVRWWHQSERHRTCRPRQAGHRTGSGMVTIRCRPTKALQTRRTVRSVASMIVVIARRDGHGQEQHEALHVPAGRHDDRRGPCRSQAPLAATTLAPWHEHEEDD